MFFWYKHPGSEVLVWLVDVHQLWGDVAFFMKCVPSSTDVVGGHPSVLVECWYKFWSWLFSFQTIHVLMFYDCLLVELIRRIVHWMLIYHSNHIGQVKMWVEEWSDRCGWTKPLRVRISLSLSLMCAVHALATNVKFVMADMRHCYQPQFFV